MPKSVFVTVGTTKFDKLIEAVSSDSVLDTLSSLGYTSVQFQTGTGSYTERQHPKIDIKYSSYFEDFAAQVGKSDLVIGHAGAGTCMEVLRLGKPLIVVVNEDLMDNHQTELAQQLSELGYLQYCRPETLKDAFSCNKFGNCRKYPAQKSNAFSVYLDKCMGFT